MLDYFELMIRNAWHISGGKGAAAKACYDKFIDIMCRMKLSY